MSQRDGKLHENHRKRCFETYLTGNVNMPDHILLEMLLFYSIPRKDTNEIAHKLINTFGSLSGVLEADAEQLKSVEGIGEYSANLLNLVYLAKSRCLISNESTRIRFANSDQYGDFFVKKFNALKDEFICLLVLDANSQMISCPLIGHGGSDSAEICIKSAVRHVLNCSGDRLVLGHNHISGICEPSDEDVMLTLQLRRVCDAIGIKFEDHIIVSGNKHMSLFAYMANHRVTKQETIVFRTSEDKI